MDTKQSLAQLIYQAIQSRHPGAEGLPGFFRALRALSDLKEEQKRMLLRAARGL